jgi:hypothetical protein
VWGEEGVVLAIVFLVRRKGFLKYARWILGYLVILICGLAEYMIAVVRYVEATTIYILLVSLHSYCH